MKLAYYSLVLNHHQICVADEFYELLGDNFVFVETARSRERKGSTDDYSFRPYLVKAWESEEACSHAMFLAMNAEVCLFGGYEGLVFQKARLKRNLLTFDVSERWLKKGFLNLFSRRIFKMFITYHLDGWKNKPVFKLCQSAFAAQDQRRLLTYINKCYKWGYFIKIENYMDPQKLASNSTLNKVQLMWCARFLKWKHPELPVLLADRLKNKGYSFHLNMYGDGKCLEQTKHLISELELGDCVSIHGYVPNNLVKEAMHVSDIFLFTSDRNEGWGVVANESLSCGCVLVASDAIGSAPYLINNGFNGYMYKSAGMNNGFAKPDLHSLDDLTNKVSMLLDNKDKLYKMKRNAIQRMRNLWSPEHAVGSLMQLIEDIQSGRQSLKQDGPCSLD
jgi:glycosyltransferase involved in cell wall biosynthesis